MPMLPNQMFNAVLSSLRTFDPLSDTLDILIISFVFYQLLQFARKSRAGQLVKGIILILVFYGLAVMRHLGAQQRHHHRLYGRRRHLPAGAAPHARAHGSVHNVGQPSGREPPQ